MVIFNLLDTSTLSNLFSLPCFQDFVITFFIVQFVHICVRRRVVPLYSFKHTVVIRSQKGKNMRRKKIISCNDGRVKIKASINA